MKDPFGLLRPRHKSAALLVPPAQAGRQEVEHPTKYLNCHQGKKPTPSQRILRNPVLP